MRHRDRTTIDAAEALPTTVAGVIVEAVDVREPPPVVCAALAGACAEVFGARYAGVLIFETKAKRVRHRGASRPVGETLDDRQFALGQGPLVDAVRQCAPVTALTLDGETRWPRWQELAAAWSLDAVRVLPLIAGAGWIGFVTLYFKQRQAASATTEETIEVTTALGTELIDIALHISGLQRALETRGTIGQAQCIIMERHSIDEDRAMRVLRRLSQTQQIKLSAIARGLRRSAQARATPSVPTASDPSSVEVPAPAPVRPRPRASDDASGAPSKSV